MPDRPTAASHHPALPQASPEASPEASPHTAFYDRDAIFHEDGPLDPSFMAEAIRTLVRAMPLDPAEPQRWAHRRIDSAIKGLAAMHPRDEIEVFLAVQALSAYHAATACWRIGMNQRRPNGDSTRHISAAATAARTFETMLRALERRQAKPLFVPLGRPPPRVWPEPDQTGTVQYWEDRCRRGEDVPVAERAPKPIRPVVWTERALAVVRQMREREDFAADNAGLDLANTEGILPGGGMIVPAHPTPQQEAYMARRSGLMYRREWQENLRKGIQAYPRIRPIRVGDLIP